MAERTFFQDFSARNGRADARDNYSDGNGDRLFERGRNCLFFTDRFAHFDFLRRVARRVIDRRSVFRSARRQRLSGRGGFNSLFYIAFDSNFFDESVWKIIENKRRKPCRVPPFTYGTIADGTGIS